MTNSKKPPPKETPPKETAKSGQHPAVKAYRAKLESIAEGTVDATTKLDQELAEFLEDLKSSRPPPPSKAD